MLRRMLALVMVLSVSMAVGCATNAQKYAAGGAAVGAAAGGIWGAAGASLNALEGALVGGAAGGLVGALVGDSKERGDEFARLSALLEECNDQNERLAEKNRALKRKLAACEQELKNKDSRIATLEKLLANCKAELGKDSRVEMKLSNNVLFASGSNKITSQGAKLLQATVNKIKKKHLKTYKFITVEGHTDSDPISQTHWKDNWDLGSARALAVTRFMIKNGKLPAKMFNATSFSQYRPVASNKKANGKAKNRRSVIVLHKTAQ